jgi:predicted ATP-grasp superfamily ATP-dependent carboligase
MTGITRMAYASTILIYEYFTGGGFPPGPLPDSLASEALGMLWALLTDFGCLGMRTITALDPRFERRIPGLNRKTLPASEVVSALPGDHQSVYLSLLKRCDAALITAPETNGILSELTSQAETAGKILLSSSASAVALAGDKEACSRIFRRAKLPNPKTRVSTFAAATQVAGQMTFPLIVKPVDGVGSEGVYMARHSNDLSAVLQTVRRATSHERILLQSFVNGIPASVSLLIARGNALPLSLNHQLMDAVSPFQYRGSRVPFHHRAGGYALELACEAVGAIPGLSGYVGVDLILKNEGAQLIEINPRLTTSYIGLRQVSQINLAQAIWDACEKGILPDPITLVGQVVIKKDDPDTWNLKPANWARK